MLGLLQVLETMRSQVPQARSRGKVRGGEDLHGLRDENLAPVPRRANAGIAMHVEANITSCFADRLARMQHHPDPER
jgi:hypothetical protein